MLVEHDHWSVQKGGFHLLRLSKSLCQSAMPSINIWGSIIIIMRSDSLDREKVEE